MHRMINNCPHGHAPGDCACKPGGCQGGVRVLTTREVGKAPGTRELSAGDRLGDKLLPVKPQPQREPSKKPE